MARKSKSGKAIAQVAQRAGEIRALLGPPPLLEGEDRSTYDALHDRIYAAVRPEDTLEEIWTRDIVDLIWETLRLRGLKVALMRAAAHEGLEKILEALGGPWGANSDTVAGWMRRDQKSVRNVESQLKQAGLDQDAIAAQTLAAKLDTFEKLDRMIMQAEARRNAALREIDRHRIALAQRLRTLGKEIEDAEFAEVDARTAAAE